MDTLGTFLKQGREVRGLSLDELAVRTRIRVENLRSLEREDLDSLPTDTYVRGFVRQVCRELGLEPTDGIIRYETLRRQATPPDETTWAEEVAEEDPGFLERVLRDPDRVVRVASRAGKWVGLAAGAGALALLAVAALRGPDRQDARAESTRAVAKAETPLVSTTEAKSPESNAVVKTTAPDPAPTVAKPTAPVPAPAVTKTKAPDPAASAAAQPSTVVAKPVPSQAKTPARTVDTPAKAAPVVQAPVVRAQAVQPPPVRSPADASGSAQRVLRVEALRPVEVSVLLDGAGHARKGSLAAGETRTWKAEQLFVLSASDGGAVRLFLDDQPMGTAGGDGQAVKGLRIRPR
ncbi:MAG: helix-turn-helix domain-containing protein [Candidatus Eiseniibacteriota bacterium]